MHPAAGSIWELFNWVDVVLSIGLLAAILVGCGMGLYRQLAMIGSLIIGLLVASQLTHPLARTEMLDPVRARFGASGAEAVVFAGILAISLLLGLISIRVFRSFFGRTLRVIDSVLGGALGLVLGGLLFGSGFLLLFHWTDSPLHAPIRASFLGSRLAEGAQVVSRIFPEDYRARVDASLQQKISEYMERDAKSPTSPPGKQPAPRPHEGTSSSVPPRDR